MEDFCKSCADKGSEECQIPSIRKRIGTTAHYRMQELGALLTSDPLYVDIARNDLAVTRARTAQRITECIEQHSQVLQSQAEKPII